MTEAQDTPHTPTPLLLPPSTWALSSSSSLSPVFLIFWPPSPFTHFPKISSPRGKPGDSIPPSSPPSTACCFPGWAARFPPPLEQMCSSPSAPFSPTRSPCRQFWLDWA